MPKKRLPAIVGRTVWEKVTAGRAGLRWNSVVEKVWKDVGANHEEAMPVEKSGRWKTEVAERIKIREILALRSKVKSEKHLGVYEVKRRDRKENVARPNGLCENAATTISCRGPGTARKKHEVNQ